MMLFNNANAPTMPMRQCACSNQSINQYNCLYDSFICKGNGVNMIIKIDRVTNIPRNQLGYAQQDKTLTRQGTDDAIQQCQCANNANAPTMPMRQCAYSNQSINTLVYMMASSVKAMVSI
jgi:hypothetical protein